MFYAYVVRTTRIITTDMTVILFHNLCDNGFYNQVGNNKIHNILLCFV